MIRILTAPQLKEVVARTIKEQGISSLELMERAAGAAALYILEHFPAGKVYVFAGHGNNGGDALAVARMLDERGRDVEAYLFNTSGYLSADCAANKARLQQTEGVAFQEITAQFEPPTIEADALIVDGLFGTGVTKPLTGGYAVLVKFLNASPAKIVSLDMPSGLMCEDNTYSVRAHIVRADVTLTFQLPKLAQLLADNADNVGRLEILNIGLSHEAIADAPTEFCISERADILPLLKPRSPFGHKGTFGHALLVCGSEGMAGAAILCARACLRSGVGKTTIHSARCNTLPLQTAVPEAVLLPDSKEHFISEAIPTDNYQAVAIGPGIGTARETSIAFIEQVRHSRQTLLIDADGINILAEHKGWIQQIPADTILTPHPGEFRRLGIKSVDPFSALVEAREMAQQNSLYIVLKGRYTAICTPNGQTYFNPTGNSGMGTAGSGDVLTGVITSLLAQRYNPLDACRIGCYVHGLAGDIAARRYGEISLTASDIIEALPGAFQELTGDK